MFTNKKFLTICNSDKDFGPITHDERLAMKVARYYLRHTDFMFKNAAKCHDINFSHTVFQSSIKARMKTMKVCHRVHFYDTFCMKVMNAIKTIAEKHGYVTTSIYDIDEPYLVISPNFIQNVPLKEVV